MFGEPLLTAEKGERQQYIKRNANNFHRPVRVKSRIKRRPHILLYPTLFLRILLFRGRVNFGHKHTPPCFRGSGLVEWCRERGEDGKVQLAGQNLRVRVCLSYCRPFF